MTDKEFRQWCAKLEAAKEALREAFFFMDGIEQPLEETQNLFVDAMNAIDRMAGCEQALRSYRPETPQLTLVKS